MHRAQAASHHIQTLPQLTSLLVPADELIKRGGVAISGFGPSRRSILGLIERTAIEVNRPLEWRLYIFCERQQLADSTSSMNVPP
jgi:hypothetical protein